MEDVGTCPCVLWDAIDVARLDEKQLVSGLLVSMAAEGRGTKQPGIMLKEKKIRQDLMMGEPNDCCSYMYTDFRDALNVTNIYRHIMLSYASQILHFYKSNAYGDPVGAHTLAMFSVLY